MLMIEITYQSSLKNGLKNSIFELIAPGCTNPIFSPLTGKTELHRGGTILRVGDRVIQRVNDYDREVFNGDQGRILEVNLEDQEIQIQFEDRIVSYDYGDLDEISLAYAVTVHKSQGSEYPVVILSFFTQHYMMLSRNLFYTGLTRAKQLAIIVGQSKAIGIAIRQIKDQERYILLHQRLNRLI